MKQAAEDKQNETLHADGDCWEQLTFGISASERLGGGALEWDGAREASRTYYVSLLSGKPARAQLHFNKQTALLENCEITGMLRHTSVFPTRNGFITQTKNVVLVI